MRSVSPLTILSALALFANACGAPVIAYARGGATETIVPLGREGATGVWFEEQTIDCFVAAMETLERQHDRLDPLAARTKALHFAKSEHVRVLTGYLNQVLSARA